MILCYALVHGRRAVSQGQAGQEGHCFYSLQLQTLQLSLSLGCCQHPPSVPYLPSFCYPAADPAASSSSLQLPSPSSGPCKPGSSPWLPGTSKCPASSVPETSQVCSVLNCALVFMGRMMSHSTVHGVASKAAHTACLGGETSDTPATPTWAHPQSSNPATHQVLHSFSHTVPILEHPSMLFPACSF